MEKVFLDFESDIAELEGKIEEIRHVGHNAGMASVEEEVERIRTKILHRLKEIYSHLESWQTVQVARHPLRPRTTDYVRDLIEDFVPLAGDRAFGEDQAIIGGLGRFFGQSVVVLGHEKGHDTKTRLQHSFGMPRPEGYRKAQRLMSLANHFHLPLLSFVDTAGAFPGRDAEERGQAQSIARSMQLGLSLRVPVIATIIGEGGSGGAIAVAVANEVLMMEHAIYSVISPEGCASILWRSDSMAKEAAEALRLTSRSLKNLKLIDEVIPEPIGGAHRSPAEAVRLAGQKIKKSLEKLQKMEGSVLSRHRRDKFLEMTRHFSR